MDDSLQLLMDASRMLDRSPIQRLQDSSTSSSSGGLPRHNRDTRARSPWSTPRPSAGLRDPSYESSKNRFPIQDKRSLPQRPVTRASVTRTTRIGNRSTLANPLTGRTKSTLHSKLLPTSPYGRPARRDDDRRLGHRYEDDQLTFMKRKSQSKDRWMEAAKKNGISFTPVST